MSATPATKLRPPKESLLRANFRGVELRSTEPEGEDPAGPIMSGYFAVFDQWTEIKSYYEGNFLERFAKGAFRKTIQDNRDSMRVLFQHGYDYSIGDKPLGPIDELREDDEGPYYEVPLLDASYVRDQVLPGLEAELYGASFRFRVIREEIDEEPGVSDHNPNGLPERTIKEAQVMEFGPVTFPAYEGASAGVRSLRPSDLVRGLTKDPESHVTDDRDAEATTSRDESSEVDETTEDDTTGSEVEETEEEQDSTDAPPEDSAETQSHPDDGRREKPPFGGTEKRTPPWRQPSKRKPPWASAGKE
jgi:HK97 family phage prohead protease